MSADHKPRRGRPTVLDAVVDCKPDGSSIRVLDAIATSLSAGNYFETSCALAGVTAEQAYGWLRTAGKIRIRAIGRKIDDLELSHLERLCLEFSEAVFQAEHAWEAAALATLDRLGTAGNTLTTTNTREVIDAKTGEVRERIVTTTVRELAPAVAVLMWRLSRRFPQRYGNNAEVEQNVTLSDEDVADGLADSLEAWLAEERQRQPND